MTYKKKTDANHAQIRQLFRDLGCAVYDSSGIPKFVDLVVQFTSPRSMFIKVETCLVEIKDGSLPPSRRKLTPDQVKFHAQFNCHIVECEQDVFLLLGMTNPDGEYAE